MIYLTYYSELIITIISGQKYMFTLKTPDNPLMPSDADMHQKWP